MRKKERGLAPPYAAATKDTRFAGTFEVRVPASGRVKPHRVPQGFETLEQADTWIHSPEGKDLIKKLVSGTEK
jgi:hypothetical protein